MLQEYKKFLNNSQFKHKMHLGYIFYYYYYYYCQTYSIHQALTSVIRVIFFPGPL